MKRPALLTLLTFALVASADVAHAQSSKMAPEPDDTEGSTEGTESADEEPGEDQPAVVDERSAAQANVERAKKLAKLQKYDEAIALLEEAFLTLEDPELIRILGEIHEAMGERDKAIRFYDTYLADLNVGDSAKEPVARRRAALVAQDETSSAAVTSDDIDDDEDDDEDTLGLSDWTFSDLGGGEPGRLYLGAGIRVIHNQGGSFDVARSSNPDDGRFEGDWVHGGFGFQLEFGGYLLEDLSLGLTLGNDWMSWEFRGPTQDFATVLLEGVRPEAAINLRYFFGVGFYGGAIVGGDVMVFTQAIESVPDCQPGVSCAPVEIDTGVVAYRAFFGGELGFRTHVADPLLLGVGISWKWVPIVNVENETIDQVPNYDAAGWLASLGFHLTWNL